VRPGEARRAKRRSRDFTRVISHKAVSGQCTGRRQTVKVDRFRITDIRPEQEARLRRFSQQFTAPAPGVFRTNCPRPLLGLGGDARSFQYPRKLLDG
jgi:hypothetical protein